MQTYLPPDARLRHAGPVDRLDPSLCREFARRALAEDIGTGDVTSLALLSPEANAGAIIVAREALTVAGLDLAEATFREIDDSIECELSIKEGQALAAGSPIMRLSGSARTLLSGERTALNFLQRLSGIATMTAEYNAEIDGTDAKLLDTRKTTPGWRVLEKYAVACGGGTNHRMGLHDMVLIKDNHLAALKSEPCPIAAAIARAREACPNLKIEAEADTLEQTGQAATAGADIILLDNMSPEKLREAVKLVAGRSKLEASGGITLMNIRAVAETGVDFISVGALTHSPRAVDIAMDFAE